MLASQLGGMKHIEIGTASLSGLNAMCERLSMYELDPPDSRALTDTTIAVIDAMIHKKSLWLPEQRLLRLFELDDLGETT